MGRLKVQTLLGLALLLASAPVIAQGPGEYEVKAAFIHNIAKFVEWPAASSDGNAIQLCVLGRNPFGGALTVLDGKQVGKLSWKISFPTLQSNLRACQVLFIAASEAGRLAPILDKLGDAPTLTMGDTEDYAEFGVMVNFYIDENKVRFEVNPEAASRVRLKFGSQLLKLARIVKPRRAN